MKFVVLEWICGGGMLRVEAADIPTSLRQEGWAMVTSLVRVIAENLAVAGGVQSAGDKITVARDARLPCDSLPEVELCPIDGDSQMVDGLVPVQWIELAKSHDVAIVIAPEIDWMLPRIVRLLRNSGARLWNCDEPFLSNASDKQLTASLLFKSGIAHPATVSLDRVSDEWLRSHATSSVDSDASWVVKSRTGAGCEGLSRHRCHSRHDLLSEHAELYQGMPDAWKPEHFIVQPWIAGKSYSCSAIYWRHHRIWMPLMTQEFSDEFKYAGGRVVDCEELESPRELLERAISALGDGAQGWLGVDLVYSDVTSQWVVIEVNPRLTTSIVSLEAQPGHRACMARCIGESTAQQERGTR